MRQALCIGAMCAAVAGLHSHLFEVQAGALWSVVNASGFTSAIETKRDQNGVHGSAQTLPGIWGIGAEAEVAYVLSHRPSRLALQGTWFSAHRTKEEEASSDKVFLPTWGRDADFLVDRLKTHYRLHLGFAGLRWEEKVDVGPNLSVQPFLGILYGSIRQKYFLDYGVQGEDVTVLWRMKNKYWGVGPELGCKGRWDLSRYITWQVGLSAAILYGPFYIHEGERELPEQLKKLRLFNEWWMDAVVTRMQMSLSWYPWTTKRPFSIELGGDQQLLFSQNQLPKNVDATAPGVFVSNQGDISLTGLYLRFCWNY